MKIHYITLWGENNQGKKLVYSPASVSKARYVIQTLRSLHYDVQIVSFSNIMKGVFQFKGINTEITDIGVPVWSCASFPFFTFVGGIIQRLFISIQLFFYIIFRTKQNDSLVVYHERSFYWPLKFALLLVKRNLILEIEEVYTLVGHLPRKEIDKEISRFEIADAYILINDLIADYCKLNTSRPHIICYGKYDSTVTHYDKFSDGKIHVLYSGIIDEIKGGARAALESASFLSDNYHLHIAGFGQDRDIESFYTQLRNMNNSSDCKVTFHGCLNKSDLDILMQRSHIGLCTHDPTLELNKTAFASKILNYISNGLLVVAGKNETLEESSINDLLVYYDCQSPELIAEAIKRVDISETNVQKGFERLKVLDDSFKMNLRDCINSLTKFYESSTD